MMTTPNPKCNTCRCYWVPDETDMKSSGLVCKSCKRCRERANEKAEARKCQHGKQKKQCKDCGGYQVCEHGRQKSTCKDCGGSQVCEHGRQKSTCKDCGGSQVCEHGRRKSRCKACGGSQFCEHCKRKSTCKVCNFKMYLVNLQWGQISRCFKRSALTKAKHSIEYLGCTMEELIDVFTKKMEYFNTFLTSGELMSWDNIHIDHIKPVSSFDLDDANEFLDCCHYSNLQPLLSADNLEKSARWSEANQAYWEANIRGKDFTEIYNMA